MPCISAVLSHNFVSEYGQHVNDCLNTEEYIKL